jgi:hypothetical protein
MIEYIKNILPRLKAASQKVNRKAQLVDKTWVWVGFADEFSTIHFLRDQRLLVTKLGNVQEGKWEFIGNELIHLSGEGFNIMLNHGIIFGGVLVIQKQGVFDHFEVLYDQIEIPDGDFVKYIEANLPPLNPDPPLPPRSDYPFSIFVEEHEMCFHKKPTVNSNVSSSKVFSGKVTGLPNNLGVEIVENNVVRVFYFAVAETDEGAIELEIDNCDWNLPKGFSRFKESNIIPNGLYKINSVEPSFLSWRILVLENGKVKRVGYWGAIEYTVFVIFIGLILFAILYSLGMLLSKSL